MRKSMLPTWHCSLRPAYDMVCLPDSKKKMTFRIWKCQLKKYRKIISGNIGFRPIYDVTNNQNFGVKIYSNITRKFLAFVGESLDFSIRRSASYCLSSTTLKKRRFSCWAKKTLIWMTLFTTILYFCRKLLHFSIHSKIFFDRQLLKILY